MIRALTSAILIALMAAFGFGVYRYLESQKHLHTMVKQPSATSTVALAGRMFVAQGGKLYRFQNGRFTGLTAAGGWMQPALSPDGTRLIAVKRGENYSDLYLLDTSGHVLQQLTHNASGVVEQNHWAFYPRFSADGTSVYYSYDPKDPTNSYRVDLQIYARDIGSGSVRIWTQPNYYTGGDASPLPLKSGGLLYTKFSIDQDAKVHSQLWVQARPGSRGIALTQAADDLAMVCTHSGTGADLEVAPFNAATDNIGALTVLVSDALVAAPAFAPDGQTLAYFAPAATGGPFQLWTIALTAPSPAPSTAAASASALPAAPQPRQITRQLAFDSSGPPAWA
jgi:Tol biopolymer transport system component